MAYFKHLPKLLYSSSNGGVNHKLVSNVLAKTKFINDVLDNSSLYYTYDVQEGERPEDVAYRFYKDQSKHWIILMCNNIIDPQYDWVIETRLFDKYINSKYSSITLGLNPSESYPANYTVGETVYQGSTFDVSSATGSVAAYDSVNRLLQVKFPDEIFANNANISGVTSAQTHSIISITSNDDGLQWASNTTYHYVMTETKYNSYDQTKSVEKYKISANDFNHITNTVSIRDLSPISQNYDLEDGTTLTITKQVSEVNYYDYEWELNEKRRHIRVIKPEFVHLVENEFINLMSQ